MQTGLNECNQDLREQIRILTEGIRALTSILTTPSECLDGVKRIEQLQSKWKLEDTGFSSLSNACMHMQNTLHLTSLEADKNFDELRKVRDIASTAELEAEKMKKEMFTLQKEKIQLQKKNRVLRKKVEDHKKYKKVMARSVQNFMGSIFPRVHEIVSEEENMKKTIFTLQKEKIELQKKNRILMNEVEDYKKDKKSIACSVQSFVNMRSEKRNVALISSIPTPDPNVPRLQYSTSFSSSEGSWEEIPPPSSLGLVTDDGCAAIRFPKREVLKSESNIFEVSSPTKNIGIQLLSVFRKGYFKDKETLHVCGSMGFDDTLNRRPKIGSRLVSVDGISLGREKWKMEDFIDYICAKSGPIKMRFCDEPLTTLQMEHFTAIQ